MRKIIAFIIILFFGIINSVFAETWQETLESAGFDVVETFDELKDWKGTVPATGNLDIQTYPKEFPVKEDGSPSMWQYYSFWNDKNAIDSNWLQYHGQENVWRGAGKSMCIDYGADFYGKVRGPSRFAFKIGDSPDDGYKDEVYVFFMTRWYKDFFKYNDPEQFIFVHFLKTFELGAGFKTVRYWGTDGEHKFVEDNGGVTQVLHEYGMNGQVYNYQSYGDGHKSKIVDLTVLTTGVNNISYQTEVRHFYNSEIGQQVWQDKWFGVEYRVKMSNPHGAANGEFEVWIYNDEGDVVSHDIETNVVNFRDGNTAFDHGWNKFDWGGNRYTGDYCGRSAYTDFSFGDNYVVINGTSWEDSECKNWDLYVTVGSTIVQTAKVSDNIGNKIFIDGTWSFSGVPVKVELRNPWCEFGHRSNFYIDDIIVDGQRIGPAYFNIIKEHPFIETQSLPSAVKDKVYSQSILVSSGKAPYVWQVTGNLPVGLSWSPAGEKLIISGTPIEANTYNFEVEVTDFSITPPKANRLFKIAVVDPEAGNQPPMVNAGSDQTLVYPQKAVLSAVVTDDGKPQGKLKIGWQKISGPGRAAFSDYESPNTKVSFSEPGIYVLRLVADDGELSANDDIKIDVKQPATEKKLLVDFGSSASGNIFEMEGWNKVLIDVYTGYKAIGPGGTMVSGAYNFQGVMASESGFAHNFVPGEKVIVSWYNNSDQNIIFMPLISFTDKDRQCMGETGIWYAMNRITVPAYSIAVSEYEVDESSAGIYDSVNINATYPDKDVLICDKIELIAITGVPGGESVAGDINGDGVVTVQDVQLCVNVILGLDTSEAFVNKAKAITPPQEECTVSDLQAVVNAVLGGGAG